MFVPLEESLVEEKLRILREHYASQHSKHWFDDELFRGLMRLRGMESASRYAEAFTCRKLTPGRMIFRDTLIEGVWVIEPERFEDERASSHGRGTPRSSLSAGSTAVSSRAASPTTGDAVRCEGCTIRRRHTRR